MVWNTVFSRIVVLGPFKNTPMFWCIGSYEMVPCQFVCCFGAPSPTFPIPLLAMDQTYPRVLPQRPPSGFQIKSNQIKSCNSKNCWRLQLRCRGALTVATWVLVRFDGFIAVSAMPNSMVSDCGSRKSTDGRCHPILHRHFVATCSA